MSLSLIQTLDRYYITIYLITINNRWIKALISNRIRKNDSHFLLLDNESP